MLDDKREGRALIVKIERSAYLLDRGVASTLEVPCEDGMILSTCTVHIHPRKWLLGST